MAPRFPSLTMIAAATDSRFRRRAIRDGRIGPEEAAQLPALRRRIEGRAAQASEPAHEPVHVQKRRKRARYPLRALDALLARAPDSTREPAPDPEHDRILEFAATGLDARGRAEFLATMKRKVN